MVYNFDNKLFKYIHPPAGQKYILKERNLEYMHKPAVALKIQKKRLSETNIVCFSTCILDLNKLEITHKNSGRNDLPLLIKLKSILIKKINLPHFKW